MEKEQWAVFLAFLAGCMMPNFLGKDVLAAYGIFNDYFLNQYSYHAIDGNRLFCHILMERGKMSITVFLFGRVLRGSLFSLLVKSIAAAEVGFLLTVAVINLGARGILICLAALFPQWLLYFGVLFYFANCKKEEAAGWAGAGYAGDAGEHLIRGIILLLGMAIGVAVECYINPLFLAYVLKIF